MQENHFVLPFLVFRRLLEQCVVQLIHLLLSIDIFTRFEKLIVGDALAIPPDTEHCLLWPRFTQDFLGLGFLGILGMSELIEHDNRKPLQAFDKIRPQLFFKNKRLGMCTKRCFLPRTPTFLAGKR